MADDNGKKAIDQVVHAGNILEVIKQAAAAQGIPLGGGESTKRSVKLSVGVKEGSVVIDFGQQVTWMSMAPDQATKFAASIMAQVQNILKAPGTTGEPKEVDKPE